MNDTTNVCSACVFNYNCKVFDLFSVPNLKRTGTAIMCYCTVNKCFTSIDKNVCPSVWTFDFFSTKVNSDQLVNIELSAATKVNVTCQSNDCAFCCCIICRVELVPVVNENYKVVCTTVNTSVCACVVDVPAIFAVCASSRNNNAQVVSYLCKCFICPYALTNFTVPVLYVSVFCACSCWCLYVYEFVVSYWYNNAQMVSYLCKCFVCPYALTNCAIPMFYVTFIHTCSCYCLYVYEWVICYRNNNVLLVCYLC